MAPAPSYMGAGAPSSSQSAGRHDPNDYWNVLMDRFSGADTGYTHAAGSDAEALADLILGGYGRGAFGPEGDPRVMARLMEDAQRRGLDFERGALLSSGIEHADPWTRAQAAMNARSGAMGERARIGSQVGMDQAARYNDLLMSLFQRKLGQFDREKARGWDLEDQRLGREQAGRMAPWQIGGQILGAGLGALAGGAGGAAGGSSFPRYNYMGSGRTF